ncbi:hypothetical protein PO909_027924 [Leuciscus waleckii]
MIKRLFDCLTLSMISLARSISVNLFLKYSSFFCASLNPCTSVTRSIHSGGILLAAAGLVVIQMRAEGTRFPLMRFVRRTSREAGDDTSRHVSLPSKFRGRRHSSNPSRMNRTLNLSFLARFSPFISGKKNLIRLVKLCFSFSFKFISRNARGNMKVIS